MTRSVSRRRFLQETAAATTFYLALPYARGDEKKTSPNERVNVAVIGVCNRGADNIKEMEDEANGLFNMVALCDVDTDGAAKARKKYPEAKFFQDYRKVMDLKNLDAVLIATPDHMHALPALAAMRSGRQVYCEKPLAHTVHEVRLLRETAAKTGAVTQMGTQIHAGENYRRVVELIQSGAIGKIGRVHVWCNAKPRPAPKSWRESPDKQAPGFAYDLWLGPAAMRPYDKNHLNFYWRWFWDLGGGVLGDMACHYMDLPFWALSLKAPTRVAAKGTQVKEYQTPSTQQVDYQFPTSVQDCPVQLSWYHGVAGPDLTGNTEYEGFGSGVLFEGDKGKLLANYGKYKLLPEEQFKDFKAPPKTIAKSKGHHREWLEAIKSKGTTTCNFDYSGGLTEAVLLGNVAYRTGEAIQWDGNSATIPNSSQASNLLDKEYRKGWSLDKA